MVDAVLHSHWRTTTFVAGLRSTSVVAPLVLNGPAFLAHAEQFLAPALWSGDVVMDNFGVHKGAGVEGAIRAGGASLLYLPPYSPGLDPIEQLFAKLKTLLSWPNSSGTSAKLARSWATAGTAFTASRISTTKAARWPLPR